MIVFLLLILITLFGATNGEAKTATSSFLSTSQLPQELVTQARDQSSLWHRHYSAGTEQLKERRYDAAEKSLNDSIREAKNSRGHADELALSRTSLGLVYLATRRYHEAETLFLEALNTERKQQNEAQIAEDELGISEAYMDEKQPVKARTAAEQALEAFKKAGGSESIGYAKSLAVLACALGETNLIPEAEVHFDEALQILENHPGFHQLDYADVLRSAGVFYSKIGNIDKAKLLFEKSYEIKDKSVRLAQPPNLVGYVEYDWENGSPRSLEFPDVDVPLRYITAGDVRVASAVVDLWELFGVLISITNVSDHQVSVGVTSASLMQMPNRSKLELVDPNRIDHIRRELQMWDITYKRPWLANIQKTRTTRGFVPAQGHDLFRGPNIFGLYGSWGGTQRILPEKFALELSPEHVVEQADAPYDPSIIHSAEANYEGLTTFSLEPFESRTGILFYMNPRCEWVMLKVPVGNVSFEFPFHCRKRRISFSADTPLLQIAAGNR
jgi:tetratricopeptide (TPR) repeat protein